MVILWIWQVGEKGKKTEVQHEGASYDEHNEVLSRESPAQKFAKVIQN